MLRTLPLLFHPADSDMLLFATNVLWKTTNGGNQWEIISPDLTRKQTEVPASIGDFRTESLATMKQRGVIYALAPSPLKKHIIWAGTDDGLVHLTTDGGKTWKDVTPPAVKSWDKVTQIDAGHFDEHTAYISVNAIRKDDMKPHIYRTHDAGVTWKEITRGMHEIGPVNTIREDPKQPGLLFAGTEREVYFSADDGENWQSLRSNMPATSVRDLVINEHDLVVGTHGRSIWILDNISPLRSLANINARESYLFHPVMATRVRFNMFGDTPLPPEEPAGQNPPDGAILDYYLPNDAAEVRLEILTRNREMIRQYSSKDKPEMVDSLFVQYPMYWVRPQKKVSEKAGHHRFVWDLRYAEPQGAPRQLSIAAVYQNTPTGPQGPYVTPGTYVVRLTVDSTVIEQPIVVRLDPRVTTTDGDLRLQSDYSLTCYRSYQELQAIREAIDVKLNNPKAKWAKGKKEQVVAFRGSGSPDNPDVLYGSITEVLLSQETIVGLQDKFLHMMAILQSADVKPTAQAMLAIDKLKTRKEEMVSRWKALNK
jgi:photosystem II stability/assembly factor-like uncharacterized protein